MLGLIGARFTADMWHIATVVVMALFTVPTLLVLAVLRTPGKSSESKESTRRAGGFGLPPGRGKSALPPEEARQGLSSKWSALLRTPNHAALLVVPAFLDNAHMRVSSLHPICCSEKARLQRFTASDTRSVSTRYRYFGTHTTWY